MSREKRSRLIILRFASVVGFGIDPDIQIDIINELDTENATFGITQVAGLHNNSKAFLFRGRYIILFYHFCAHL